MRPALRVAGALIGILAGAAGARAEEARFALTVDYELLTRLVSRELGGTEVEPATLWASDDGCTTLKLDALQIRPVDGGRLGIGAAGRGRAGLGVLGWCLFPLQRAAELRVRARPTIEPSWQLRLGDVTSELVGPEGTSTRLTRRLGGLVEERVETVLRRMRVDLAPPIDSVRSVVESSLYGEHAQRARAALQSLRPLDAAAADEGVMVHVAMDVPPATPGPPVPEPALTPEERVRWEAALANWDTFLTFAVKHFGIRDRDPEAIDTLFALFVDGRHAILEVLASGPHPGDDPVRALFLESWEGMRGIVRRVARSQAGSDVALHYVRFLAAGDALAALERIGPDVGIEISADGLRRLARTLDPESINPLDIEDETPDPELREIFGFHEPPTGRLPNGPQSAVEPGSRRASWWPWSPVVHAAGTAAEDDDLPSLGTALSLWVPTRTDAERYRALVSRLLDAVASREHAEGGFPGDLRGLYRQLVRTVAWQESCWRQFVRRGGGVTFLESSTDDVGIMQVNRRVWRGLFDQSKLEWDVVYNADAGAQVVAQMLLRYGRRETTARGGHPARATYAAYNGGPAAYRRYRTGKRATRYTRKADAAFWKKFQITAAGRELDHVPCTDDVT